MVAKKRERHDRSFQQVRGAVLRKLKTDRMAELLESYVGELRGGPSVVVNAALLEGLEVETIQRAGNRPGFGPGLSEPGVPGGDPSTLGGPDASLRVPGSITTMTTTSGGTCVDS